MEKDRRIIRYLERKFNEEESIKNFYLEKLSNCRIDDTEYYEEYLIRSNEKAYLLKEILEEVKSILEKELIIKYESWWNID